MAEAGGADRDRYSRQILFPPIGEAGQVRFSESRVAVIGLGALGTVSANCLARAGIGYLKLVDRDFVEFSNLQRQILYTEADAMLAAPKAAAARERLAAVNSTIIYEQVVMDVNCANVESVVSGMDLVLDATDNFEIRYLVNEACVKHEIPWIYGACVAGHGITFTILPGETACLACFLGGLPPAGHGDTCDTAGVISPIVNVIASLQSVEAMKLLSGSTADLNRQAVFVDLWSSRFSEFSVSRNQGCTVCGERKFALLSGARQQRTASICGRDAVQVLPAVEFNLALEDLACKLSPLGTVINNGYFLKFFIEGYELAIFPDGRAMVKGTTDSKVARSLYARYVGL